MNAAAPAARRFLFVVASARRGGNSELLARRAAAAIAGPCDCRWLYLPALRLGRFRDRREATGPWPAPRGDAARALAETLAATDLVFVAPLYWYGPPTALKLYLDHWSAWLRAPGVEFRKRMRGKQLWLVSAMSDADPRKAGPFEAMVGLTADYMGMHRAGTLLGHGNRRGDVLADAAAMAATHGFFAQPSSPAAGAVAVSGDRLAPRGGREPAGAVA